VLEFSLVEPFIALDAFSYFNVILTASDCLAVYELSERGYLALIHPIFRFWNAEDIDGTIKILKKKNQGFHLHDGSNRL
tara:strand:- start:18909 stop:19145 length:237 start_codon:yes stop_codon:yes gene_type:complete